MRGRRQGKYIILHGGASAITASLLIVYAWKASRIVSAYMRVEGGHFWLSAYQAVHIQPLFMVAVLAGIVQQIPYLVERWLRQGDDDTLRDQGGGAVQALYFDGWLFLVQGIPAFIVMELPYILVGIGTAVWGSPVALIPPAVSVHLGWGDSVLSSLAALWFGGTLVRAVQFSS